jgi:hypothetical protein
MSQLMINGYRFNVLQQFGSKVLLQWFEGADRIEKTRWVDLKNLNTNNSFKQAA